MSLTSPGLLESQSTMDFKDKSMLLGYINLKISKWYASLRCPMLSKALKQYLTGGKSRSCLWWASSQGEPRLWGIKERGGEGVNENIKRGGGVGLPLAYPHVSVPWS